MKKVTIYTDGACSGNPGPGGWGAILMYGQYKKELSGGEANTTNNRMELTAVIRGLEALKEPCVVLASPPEISFRWPLYSNIAPQPPGPGLPEQAPSV